MYHLMNYFVPDGQNYIIIESLNSIKENLYPLSIHVLMFIENEGNFVLGRGHESDVRISDISVSRSHARICMKGQGFWLEDTGSKFGTLVLAKDPVQICDGEAKILQIGRTLMKVTESLELSNKKNFKEDFISKLNDDTHLDEFQNKDINMMGDFSNFNFDASVSDEDKE